MRDFLVPHPLVVLNGISELQKEYRKLFGNLEFPVFAQAIYDLTDIFDKFSYS